MKSHFFIPSFLFAFLMLLPHTGYCKDKNNEFKLNNQSLAISQLSKKSFLSLYAKTLALGKGASKKSEKYADILVQKYRLALASLLFFEPKMALNILPTPEEFNQAGLPADRLLITKARAQFQNNNYAEAVETYGQIPQDSDFWLTAIEEKSHVQGKAGNYAQAIANFTTLFSPVFQKALGPEAYFTATLTYQRVCQFSKVFEFINLFKEQMKQRIPDLTRLAEGQQNEVILNAAQNLREKKYHSVSYAQTAPLLPYSFHLDFTVRDLILKEKSPNNSINNDRIIQRVRELGQQDLNDIKSHLTQIQLVEAEVMQRLHLVESGLKESQRNKMGQFKAGPDQLYFPFNNEVWIDELDHYQAQAKGCPQNKAGGGT